MRAAKPVVQFRFSDWRIELQRKSLAWVEVVADSVVVEDNFIVSAYDAIDGAPRWTYPVTGRLMGVSEEVAVVALGNREAHLLNCSTGLPRGSLWGALSPSDARSSECRGSIAGSLLIIGGLHEATQTPVVRAINIETGQRLWTNVRDAGALWASNSSVVVCEPLEGGLACLDARDGSLIWKRELNPLHVALSGTDLYVMVARTVKELALGGATLVLEAHTGIFRWEAPGSIQFIAADRAFSTDGNFLRAWHRESGKRDRRRHRLDWPRRVQREGAVIVKMTEAEIVVVSTMRQHSAFMSFDRAGKLLWVHAVEHPGEKARSYWATGQGACLRTESRLYGFGAVRT